VTTESTEPAAGATNAAGTEAAGSVSARGVGADADAALRVLRGEPTAEELAALVAVLAARAADGAGAGAAEPARAVSGWTDRSRYVRSGRLGFGARTGWRASTLPR
jgi:hypothetical protein